MIKWNTRTQATESDYHTLLGKHSLHFLHIEFLGMSRWEVKIWTVSGIYTVPLPLLECSKLLGEKKLSSHTNAIASAQLNGHISTMLMHPHSIHSTCMLSPVHDRHWDLKLPYLCLFRLKATWNAMARCSWQRLLKKQQSCSSACVLITNLLVVSEPEFCEQIN